MALAQPEQPALLVQEYLEQQALTEPLVPLAQEYLVPLVQLAQEYLVPLVPLGLVLMEQQVQQALLVLVPPEQQEQQEQPALALLESRVQPEPQA